MKGFTNRCPLCGTISSFTPEEMECDNALVLWCNYCRGFINQTFTLKTFRKWWSRYDEGEDKNKPPISKNMIENLELLEKLVAQEENCFLDKVEIHFKDFTDYRYTMQEGEDDR